MLIYLLIAIAAVIVVFVIVVAMQPAAFRVVRTASIAAPPAAVFERVNDLHAWQAWSPWQKLDPAMTQTYDGPQAGAGAGMAWSGNNKVGQGRMTITDSRPDDLVRLRLEFLRPFKATNTAEFTFQPQAGQTLVTWAMTGERNFVFKAFGLFMNMDKLIGRDFEHGLAQLKSVTEAAGSTVSR
jgi:uncharacterized protein YndB with AHSA1/START domain